MKKDTSDIDPVIPADNIGNTLKAASEKEYFAEAKSWEHSSDEMKDKLIKRSTLYGIAGLVVGAVGIICATAQSIAPKPAPPILRVDNASGVVEVITELVDGKTTYDQVLNKSFAQQYVRYRESYSRNQAEDYYYKVGIMSGEGEQQAYAKWFSPKNPDSPLNVYGDVAKVKFRVKGTNFIGKNEALVRWIRCVERGGDATKVTHWASYVKFSYSGEPMSEKDREINPLGFQALDYRKEPESVNEAYNEFACEEKDKRPSHGSQK